MRPLAETQEYKFGRRGEVVVYTFLLENGFTGFDQSGTANGRAPLLDSKFKNMIAPDALMIHHYPLFVEIKTKGKFFGWNGGAREAADAMPRGPAHGIERRAFSDYCDANRVLPVSLWFLCEETGELHAGSLDELGEPYPSSKPEIYDMVNWPISRMWCVAQFDQERLSRFLNKPTLVERMPADAVRRNMLSWLQPRQPALAAFQEDFINRLEQLWHERSTGDNWRQIGNAVNSVMSR